MYGGEELEGEHNWRRLTFAPAAVVVVDVSFDFDWECFDEDVEVEEMVFVCSWYKCCIRLHCSTSWENDDPEDCLWTIIEIGEEMREFLLLNDIVKVNQSAPASKTFLLRWISRLFLGEDLQTFRTPSVFIGGQDQLQSIPFSHQRNTKRMGAGERQRSRRWKAIIMLQIERKPQEQSGDQSSVPLCSMNFLPPHWSSRQKLNPCSGPTNTNNWHCSDIHQATTDWSDEDYCSNWDFKRNRHRQYLSLETVKVSTERRGRRTYCRCIGRRWRDKSLHRNRYEWIVEWERFHISRYHCKVQRFYAHNP